MTGQRALGGFAGPGGWDEGAHLLGLDGDLDIAGVEIDEHACAAAVTAGHHRQRMDIRNVLPEHLYGVRGAILSSPCPTFSRGGTGSGHRDMQILLDAITCAGAGCGHEWAFVAAQLAAAADPRTALAAEVMRFALDMPDLEWLILEQAPTVEELFSSIAAELTSYDDGGEDSVNPDGSWNPEGTGSGGHGPGWAAADILHVEATHFGLPARRGRLFLVAHRHRAPHRRGVPDPSMTRHDQLFSAPTMAQALGWPPGHRMRTRGHRRPTGGNEFSCDGPSWCLTSKARSWERVADGLRLTPDQAGLLNGFRPDYPWSGSRTAQFQQSGDVVVPPVAAAVLGYVLGVPWVDPVRRYLGGLYGDVVAQAPTRLPVAAARSVPDQLNLFDLPRTA